MATVQLENHSLKPTQLAEMQRLSALHKERLREIARRRHMVAVAPDDGVLPRIVEHSRRTRLEQERCADIERSNHKLLKRLESITFGRKKDSDDLRLRSLNYTRRKRDQERINQENAKLLKRLEQSRSVFSVSQWKKEDEKHRKLVHSLQQYRERSPPRSESFDDGQYSALDDTTDGAGRPALLRSTAARPLARLPEPDRSISAPPRRAVFRSPTGGMGAHLPPLRHGDDDTDVRLPPPQHEHAQPARPRAVLAGPQAKTFQETLTQLREQVLEDMKQEERRAVRRPMLSQDAFQDEPAPRSEPAP